MDRVLKRTFSTSSTSVHSYGLSEVAEYWESVVKINEWQESRFVRTILESMFNTVAGKRIALLGFAFKANTGDTRESPAIYIARGLAEERAEVVVTDPQALANAQDDLVDMGDRVRFESDPYTAAEGAHALAILTEWNMYRQLDYARILASMEQTGLPLRRTQHPGPSTAVWAGVQRLPDWKVRAQAFLMARLTPGLDREFLRAIPRCPRPTMFSVRYACSQKRYSYRLLWMKCASHCFRSPAELPWARRSDQRKLLLDVGAEPFAAVGLSPLCVERVGGRWGVELLPDLPIDPVTWQDGGNDFRQAATMRKPPEDAGCRPA